MPRLTPKNLYEAYKRRVSPNFGRTNGDEIIQSSAVQRLSLFMSIKTMETKNGLSPCQAILKIRPPATA